MLRKKHKFDREFNILVSLIGEIDDFLKKIDKILEDDISYLFNSFAPGTSRGWRK